MANLIQGTVYQIDGNSQSTAITLAFPTDAIAIREAAISNISQVNSAIRYYSNPNNALYFQDFYVSEEIADLVTSAGAEQIQTTIIEIDGNIQSLAGVEWSFPPKLISISEHEDTDTGVQSIITFKGSTYSSTDTEDDLVTAANAGGGGGSSYFPLTLTEDVTDVANTVNKSVREVLTADSGGQVFVGFRYGNFSPEFLDGGFDDTAGDGFEMSVSKEAQYAVPLSYTWKKQTLEGIYEESYDDENTVRITVTTRPDSCSYEIQLNNQDVDSAVKIDSKLRFEETNTELLTSNPITIRSYKNTTYPSGGTPCVRLHANNGADSIESTLELFEDRAVLTSPQMQLSGRIKTADPGSGAGLWKLGALVGTAVTPDTTRFIEVEIDEVVYKLIIST